MAGRGRAVRLALLTKIHAWFLVPVVGLWALARLAGGGRHGDRGFQLWLVVGFGVFFAGWPWLWYDTTARLVRYLGTGVERSTIHTLYFGTVYADRDVPWHYPWFYFVATVPAGLQRWACSGGPDAPQGPRRPVPPLAAGGHRALSRRLQHARSRVRRRAPLLDGFSPLGPADRSRIRAALGAAAGRTAVRALVVTFLLAQGYGVARLHPFGLSYYNLLVGGLPGGSVWAWN